MEEKQLEEKKADVVDILDTTYPLMVYFKSKAPGSFTHCKNVASLCDSVSSELKLKNHELLKIAACYHDIGKSINPEYFIENQGETNPHDSMDPHISLKYISSHVGDTVQILINDPNIPRKVVEWCSQHHGCSVVRYFYAKSGIKDPERYRYQCSKPKSIESLILMVCDQLEAKSRAIFQNEGKLEDIHELVEGVFSELLEDEQLDDVVLKLGMLRVIKDILKREISSIYHKRIVYNTEQGGNGVE